ncbi:MAG TPA: UvrD-helicase domain-containing protein [Phycisphaerae bacterium]|nr:UvrD-helicase domain-containing protein [Phycisphaerae bacterium]
MDIFDGLTESQAEAVRHVDGPILVLAGAGSGKTRVITRRIAYLMSQGAAAWQILAITFTNKAAGEMRERTESLVPGAKRPLVTTFHSFCARMLREYGDLVGVNPAYTIYDSADQTAALKRAMERLNLDPTHFSPDRAAETISRAKNRLQRASDFARPEAQSAMPGGEFWGRHAARIYEAYETILRENRALDFDDLLMAVALGLRESAEFRALMHDRFRYILVDEYQDTNHAQYVLARDLAGEQRNLCVTGDPDQSIYGWRGAELSNILDFEKDFPETKVVRLEKNYRSTKTILAAADAVIQQNRHRKAKALYTENPVGEPVRIVETDDEEAEADAIVREIVRLKAAGLEYREAAVFVRTVAQTRALEDALRRARPPIPYEVVRGTSFYERKEVRDVLAYLEVLHNPRDEVNLDRIINTPPRGIGKKTVETLRAWAHGQGISLLEALPHLADVPDLAARAPAALGRFKDLMDGLMAEPRDSLQGLLEAVIDRSGYADSLHEEETERKENLDELVTLGANFDRMAASSDTNVPRGLEGFLETVNLSSDQDGYDEKADRVPLMTLHAAKGLEFPAVFIAGCEDGLLPHERHTERGGDGDVEEERRLFFVGMTRAKRHLTLTWARYRRLRGRLDRCCPSRFLEEIPPETVERMDETTGTHPVAPEEGWGYTGPGPDRKTRAEKDAKTGLAVGQMVRHPTYGLGRVEHFTTTGGRRMVRVRFGTVGEKLLDPTYAKLEPVGPA